MVQADLEDRYRDMVPSVYYLMLDGLDLKTIAESKEYLDIDSVKKILLSWELGHLALTDIRLLEIYKFQDKDDMETALKEYVECYKKHFFKYPDDYMEGFFYVNSKWVKKNRRGEVVEILERPTKQEIMDLHINHPWFTGLRMEYEGILHSYDKELMFEQDLILEESKSGELDPLDMVEQVCELMFSRYSPKTIIKKTGLSKKSVEKILVSIELERTINASMSLARIYRIPNEADMEVALKEYTAKYKSIIGFNDPQHHKKGFVYVGQYWVKKDIAGKTVKRIKRLNLKELPHAKKKWFRDLIKKYRDIRSAYDMELATKAIEATLDKGNSIGLRYC